MSIREPIEYMKPVEFERELANEPIVREWLESYGWTTSFQFGGRGVWIHPFFRHWESFSTTAALVNCRQIPSAFLPDKRRGVRHVDSDSETPQPQRWIPSSRFLPAVLHLGGTYLPKVEEVK